MSQSQISRTLRDEAAVARIASLLSCEQFDSRSALGRLRGVCLCRRARPSAACRLPEGAGRPEIVLPAPKSPTIDRRPRLLVDDIAAEVPARAFGIIVVGDRIDRAVTLIAREHPRRPSPAANISWARRTGGGVCRRRAARDRWMERRAAPEPPAADRLSEPFLDQVLCPPSHVRILRRVTSRTVSTMAQFCR